MTQSLWSIPPGLAASGLGQAAMPSWDLSALDPGVCQQMTQDTAECATACLAACLLSVLDPVSYFYDYPRIVQTPIGNNSI